jgi:hypothetical protein
MYFAKGSREKALAPSIILIVRELRVSGTFPFT